MSTTNTTPPQPNGNGRTWSAQMFGGWAFVIQSGAVGVLAIALAWLLWTAQQNALEERTLCREHIKSINDRLDRLQQELNRRP